MQRIEISVQNRVAWQTNSTDYICGNNDFVVDFTFDNEWSKLGTKTARFIHGGQHTDIVFTGTECKVPEILNVKNMKIGVFAGNLYTTTPAMVHCRKSILCGGGVPANPEPDVYAQMMEMIDSGMLKGEKGEKGEPGEKGNPGKTPVKGVDYFDGEDGKDGKSAYEIAVDNGFEGTEEEWLESLNGNGLGEVVEITDISDVPDDFKVYGTAEQGGNLFDGELELGELDFESGELVDSDWAVRSVNYTPVNGGSVVLVISANVHFWYVFEYDENKNFINLGNTDDQHRLQLRDETRYIKLGTESMDGFTDTTEKCFVLYEEETTLQTDEVERGAIDSTTGLPVNSQSYAISADFIQARDFLLVTCEAYDADVYEYDENKEFIGRVDNGYDYKFLLQSETRYVKLWYSDIIETVPLTLEVTVRSCAYADSSTYAVNLKEYVESILPSEVWTFTLADGTTVEKEVVVR